MCFLITPLGTWAPVSRNRERACHAEVDLSPGSVCGGLPQVSTGPALPGHWLLDTGTMLMRLSPGFAELLGIGRTASLPFLAFLAMVHPDDRDTWKR